MNKIQAMTYQPVPGNPTEVVPDDRTRNLCDRCGDKTPMVFTDDEQFCQDCADALDAAAENEFDRQKDERRTEGEK